MKNQKGITLSTLVVTIIILVILAAVSLRTGSEVLNSSKMQNLKTNMLLIQAKAREYTENGTGKFKTITYFHKSCYEKNTIGYMKKKEI